MKRTILKGLNGSKPLGFMASVGLLRILDKRWGTARLGFTEDGAFHAWIECTSSHNIVDAVSADAKSAAGAQSWRLEYEKKEKKGVKKVADLKAPPEKFTEFLASAITEWISGREERAEYAAAYGTDIAVDSKKNTKPTALHFTAANQQFLGTVEDTRGKVTREWVEESLYDSPDKIKPGANLRWDPDTERNRALLSTDPSKDDTVVNAPLEWLAFRALPAFRCVPTGKRIVTCGVTGRRQDELRFHWPLWSGGASYAAVCSVLSLAAAWVENEEEIKHKIEECRESAQHQRSLSRLRRDLDRMIGNRRARGVFAICSSTIRRSAQGFGNFGPAHVRT